MKHLHLPTHIVVFLAFFAAFSVVSYHHEQAAYAGDCASSATGCSPSAADIESALANGEPLELRRVVRKHYPNRTVIRYQHRWPGQGWITYHKVVRPIRQR